MHAVCDDARGERTRILDCAEMYPIKFGEESLFLCWSTGDTADFAVFEDLRREVRLGLNAEQRLSKRRSQL